MTDFDRLHTLARACVQAAHEVNDTETAAMLLENAQRFLSRHPKLNSDAQAFNRQQIYDVLKH
jgi:hypothetical protein